MICDFFPVRTLLCLKDHQEFDKIKGLLRWFVAVDCQWLRSIENFIISDLLVKAFTGERVIRIDTIYHLEEDDTNRPYISLNQTIYTLSPYFLLLITSGAIVVMVPTAVFLTYSFSFAVSNFFEKPKSMILYVPL